MLITDPDGENYLHLLEINNKVIVPYKPPTPPKGSGVHRYEISIFIQDKKVKSSNFSTSRNNFHLEIEGLNLVDIFVFHVIR